jgi:hypothetical protein
LTLLSAGVESEVVWSQGLVKRSRGRRESLDTDVQGEDRMAGEGLERERRGRGGNGGSGMERRRKIVFDQKHIYIVVFCMFGP